MQNIYFKSFAWRPFLFTFGIADDRKKFGLFWGTKIPLHAEVLAKLNKYFADRLILDWKIGEKKIIIKECIFRTERNLFGFFSLIHKNRHVIEVKKWPTAMWADQHTQTVRNNKNNMKQTANQRRRQILIQSNTIHNMIYCAIEWNTISIQTQTRTLKRTIFVCAAGFLR